MQETEDIVTRLQRRVLLEHGGQSDPWRDHWNLTPIDSEMHREAATTIATLRAEVEGLRADAERYRWLRDDSISAPEGMRELYVIARRLPFTDDSDEAMFGEKLDAAIDAAKADKEGA